MRKVRALGALLAAALLLPAPSRAAEVRLNLEEAPAFADTAGTWCEDAVKTVCGAGVMNGKSAERFDPGGGLTYCQAVTAAARLLERLKPEEPIPARKEGGPWYQPYYEYLWAAVEDREVFYPYYFDRDDGNYVFMANEPCTREEFVRMLSYALLCAGVELEEKNEVASVPDVSPDNSFGSAGPAILSFYRAGILSGTGELGLFEGEKPLNRGQAAAMLARLADPAQRLTVELKGFDLCRDVLLLEPETVLAKADGVEITADEASVLMAYSGDIASFLEDLRGIMAARRLAEERGLSWSMEGLEAYNPWGNGWRGMSRAGWNWSNMESYFLTLLNDGQMMDPNFARDGFYDGIFAAVQAKEAEITVEAGDALKQFDFAAFKARLKESPF